MSTRLSVEEVTPSYWRAVIGNPPINLFDPELFAELRQLLARMEASKELKVVVFSSANPDYFIAHFDLLRGGEVPDVPGAAAFTEWPNFVTRLAQCPVATIALVRGIARGHGSELALACDMRFASLERAVFCQLEVGMGVVPGGGAMDWLPLLLGRSRALEVLMGADDFDAQTAERYGWVNRAVPDARLDEFVDRLARRIAVFDRQALGTAKKFVNGRAGFATDADRWMSNQAFLAATNWPGVRERAAVAFGLGLQQDGDFERRLGERLPELRGGS